MASLARVLRPAVGRVACRTRPSVKTTVATRIYQQYDLSDYFVEQYTYVLFSARPLSTTQPRLNEAADITEIPPTPISHLSEIEASMAEAVSKFANDVIGPKVREMDEKETMDPAIVEQLFEQGLMGIEIPEKYGGAGMNFTAAIVGIEELARVDPSVSVLVDVHNTLVNTAILKYASTELKERFLPKLATNTVGKLIEYTLTYRTA
jgi:short/branched chain acyl-CoA dehydrogenase